MVSTKDQAKQSKEREVVRSLAAARGWPVDWKFFVSGNKKGEPDVLYSGKNYPVAFEVTEICDQEIAFADSLAARTGDVTYFTRMQNVATRILEKKLSKNYVADCQVELVCFWNARTFESDQQIIDQISSMIEKLNKKFEKVWYHGAEDVYEFSNDGNPPINHGPYPLGVKLVTVPIMAGDRLDAVLSDWHKFRVKK